MKLWIDDVRPAPKSQGYWTVKSVFDAVKMVRLIENNRKEKLELIDIDHDAGDFAKDGGDYIEFLKWLEDHGYKNLKIHIHSMNIVGVQNMKAIIKANEKNGWKEV